MKSNHQLFDFEPREYALLQWYVPVGATIFSIICSKLVVVTAFAEKVSFLKRYTLFARVHKVLETLIQIYFASRIMSSVSTVRTLNGMCQFFVMSETNYWIYVTYVFDVTQLLLNLPFTKSFTIQEMLALIRQVMRAWIMIFQRVGYNWVIVLRNLLSSIMFNICFLLDVNDKLKSSVENLSDVSLLLLYFVRVSAVFSMIMGSEYCSGRLPSCIADINFATMTLYNLIKSKYKPSLDVKTTENEEQNTESKKIN
jgi:hypothetical protein